jgi:hypothetical protein
LLKISELYNSYIDAFKSFVLNSSLFNTHKGEGEGEARSKCFFFIGNNVTTKIKSVWNYFKDSNVENYEFYIDNNDENVKTPRIKGVLGNVSKVIMAIHGVVDNFKINSGGKKTKRKKHTKNNKIYTKNNKIYTKNNKIYKRKNVRTRRTIRRKIKNKRRSNKYYRY